MDFGKIKKKVENQVCISKKELSGKHFFNIYKFIFIL